MDDKNFHASFTFFIESFTLNEIWELEKISLSAAAFKEDTNMFSTMLLLTNCEVHKAKYSDRSFDVRTE